MKSDRRSSSNPSVVDAQSLCCILIFPFVAESLRIMEQFYVVRGLIITRGPCVSDITRKSIFAF